MIKGIIWIVTIEEWEGAAIHMIIDDHEISYMKIR